MNNNNIFFFDVDGTLKPHGHKLSDTTISTIKQLKKNNILAIATGRHFDEAIEIANILGIDYIISSNGMQVNYKNEILYKNNITFQEVLEIKCNVESQGYTLGYRSNYGNYIFKNENTNLNKINECFEEVNLKIPYIHSGEESNSITQLLLFGENLDKVKINSRFKILKWPSYGANISFTDVSKAHGAKYLTGNMKFRHSYAFGDAINDIELFNLVDTSIAMGNACLELKQIASFITKSDVEDGIHYFINDKQLV